MTRRGRPNRHGTIHERLTGDEPAPVSGSERGFGVLFTIVLAAVGLFPLLERQPPHWWTLAAAAGLLAAAVRKPKLLAPFNRAWFRLGLILQRFVNPLVLALLFFLVVTPTGVMMRLVRRDPLRLRRDPDAASYWIHRVAPAPASMKNQF